MTKKVLLVLFACGVLGFWGRRWALNTFNFICEYMAGAEISIDKLTED